MKMLSVLWKTLFIIAIAQFARLTFLTLWKLGVFRIVYNQRPGACWTIPMNGSEDIAMLPGGIAIITSGLRDATGIRRYGLVLPPREGKLYLFDFNQQDKHSVREIQLIESETFKVEDFVPHGISHWQDAQTGDMFLQVVNHPVGYDTNDSVEIFQLESGNLVAKHVKTVVDRISAYCLNDVSAVSNDSFYVSSDHYFESGVARRIEEWLQLSTGKLTFYDGKSEKYRSVAENVKFPNGVTMSHDGRFLYVASITGISLLIYGRDSKTQSLKFLQEIEYGSGCDNIYVEPTGEIWLGCHPRMIKNEDCFHSMTSLCDSHVLLLKLGPESDQKDGPPFPDYSLEQIYYDTGHQHKASTVAVYYEGQMLVGSVFDNLLYCQVRNLKQLPYATSALTEC